MPTSPSVSRAPNLSPGLQGQPNPAKSITTVSTPSPPSVSGATTPVRPPAPGRLAFTAARASKSLSHTNLQHSLSTEDSSRRLLDVQTQDDINRPASTISDLTEESSVARLMSSTSNAQQNHIDPQRLINYQHQVNERLTQENEMLKMQCEELMKILQKRDESVNKDRSMLMKRIHDLESAAQKQSEEHAAHESSLIDTPSEHNAFIQKVQHALSVHDVQALQECVTELQTHIPQNNVSHPDSSRPNSSFMHSHSNASWRHSTPSRVQTMESLRRSITSASTTRDVSSVASDLRNLQTTVRSLTEELHGARVQLDTALSQSSEANASKLRIETRLASTIDELEQVKLHLQQRSEQCKELEAMRREIPQTNITIERSLFKAQQEVAKAHALQQQAQQQQLLLEEQLRSANHRCDQASASADEARQARTECEAQIDEHLSQLSSLKHLLAEQHAELGRLRGEKHHLWTERREIMEQLNVFERRLREVRAETEQYGTDVKALQEKEDMLAYRASHMEQECAKLVKSYVADIVREWEPKIWALEEQCRALIFQKAYLGKALRSQQWLTERISTHLDALAPTLKRYVPASVPLVSPKTRTWRAAIRAVQFVVRITRS